ncbi:hypothetical protein PXD04_08465 [Methanosphaera sp. ISO3-F5]|uniref:hypothetical protein n=1 Tax=Methanosphaera sp. ISO3-F5 TaxID=1452353 RepID=UPI002B25A360|nr:hypothetical protein [Methanosphaera sp. ISO3-F5]WQH63726.1 hypothetical protein PXD04_08465 [Methanosphaera sp. ISO3-F5]
MKKNIKSFALILIFSLLCISTINAHGVDVTADKMIIASESDGQQVKDLADQNNINISVYKFTSNDEVNHQLEHMLNNSEKYIIVVDYQDVAHTFLNAHPEVKDRLIIIDEVTNDSLLNEMKKVQDVTPTENGSDFILPLVIGIVIGIIIGVGCGIVIMKKKE